MSTNDKKRSNRRRKVLVSSDIQWAIVRKSFWDWLLYCTTAIFLIGLLQVLYVGTSKPLVEHFQAILRTVVTLFLVFALLLPKFIYDWFHFSHRFLGPVERVRRVLRDLADGKAHTEVHFRKNDFFREMANELNSAVEALTKGKSLDRAAADIADEGAILQTDKKV